MDKRLKLITEAQDDFQITREDGPNRTKPKTYKYKGVVLVAEQKNGNGRIYPYEMLKREVDNFRTTMIDTARACSELEHPADPALHPDRICARFLSLEEDPSAKMWIGEAIVMASDEKFDIHGTPCGDLLASLITYGTKFGVSSRALGDVDEDGVVTDMQLVTLDTVLNPSISTMVTAEGNRFVNGILESKDFMCNHHGTLLEKAYDQFESALDKSPNTYISSKKLAHVKSAFDDFLAAITQG